MGCDAVAKFNKAVEIDRTPAPVSRRLGYSILRPCFQFLARRCRAAWLWADSRTHTLKMTNLIWGQPASCWSVARIQEADLAYRHGLRKESSYTCHCEKTVLHHSEASKQPEALEQYRESSDFIHSFNTRMAFFLLLLPPQPPRLRRVRGVDR